MLTIDWRETLTLQLYILLLLSCGLGMSIFRERVVEVAENLEQREVFIDCGDSLPTHLHVDSSIIREGKKIGDGRYGPVHEATWLGRKVAVKKFNLTTCNMQLMSREAGFMVRLRHPNMLKLLGVSLKQTPDFNLRCSMIMELMDSDLSKLICARKEEEAHRKGLPFLLGEAIDIIAQIARGMEYLHERGYTHRDLKPGNVLVKCSRDGQVDIKIADFGCSRLVTLDPQSTAAPTREGTRQYMAPEVYNESVTLLDKADVYSFAVMCSAILTGQEPFEEIVPRQDLQNHILRGGRPLLPDDLPEELSEIIKKCWDTDPEVRPEFQRIRNVLEPLKENFGARKPRLLADIGEALGVPAAQGQNMELFDGMGDISRDLYIHPSEITILELIGEGASAKVYKGCWQGCQYALRCEEWRVNETSRCRDMIECYKRLKHQSILSFFGYSTIDNNSILVLELMPFDLRDLIDDRVRKFHHGRKQIKVFDESTAIDIMNQIAEGMAYMHSQDILHKDIKSRNILVSEHTGGRIIVRICDFNSSDGGTGFWRAPEILKATTRRHTHKSDVYSFGMVCYEILSGRVPFEGHSFRDYDIVMRGDRPELPEHTPPDMVELITKCWHADPAQRPEFSEICLTLALVRLPEIERSIPRLMINSCSIL